MKKIIWTEEEKLQFAGLLLGARIKHPEKSLIQLANSMMGMMSRKKRITHYGQIKWITPLMQKLYAEKKIVKETVEMTKEEMLVNLDTKTLLIESVSRLYDLLSTKEIIHEIIREEEEDHLEKLTRPIPTLIVGLEPFQRQYLGLNGEYVYHNGKNLKQPLPSFVNVCVLMTRFINHNIQEICIKKYGREKIRWIHGSISALKKEIAAWKS